ncbi:MAG: hypothetical protein LAO76_13675 [Acidobacteriia bacterium]|nr:hypothetical protein [Terriglobia bacterium]
MALSQETSAGSKISISDQIKVASELLIIYAGLCYATGLLILTARFDQLGLPVSAVELFRVRNILAGGLFFLTPALLIAPATGYWAAMRTSRRRTQMSGVLVMITTGFVFCLVLMFFPLRVLDNNGVLWSLAGIIVAVSWIVIEGALRPSHPWLFVHNLLVLCFVITLCSVTLWKAPGAYDHLSSAIRLPFCLYLMSWGIISVITFGAQKASQKGGQFSRWPWIAALLPILSIYIFAAYQFGYGFYSFIPEARGGGYLGETRDAVLIFTSDAAQAGVPIELLKLGEPQAMGGCSAVSVATAPAVFPTAKSQEKSSALPSPTNGKVFCSERLKIVEETADTVYVANLKGRAPSQLGRTEGEGIVIYGIPRKLVAVLALQSVESGRQAFIVKSGKL